MNRRLVAWGFACACSCAPALASTTQQSQPDRTASAVTVEGCVTREADVPGRKPIEADIERWKRDEDYVLVDTKMIKGSAPARTADRAAAAPQPTGTSGAANAPLMFKVEKLPIEQVREHRGQRVQIDGTLRNEERAANTVSPAFDLVKLDGTSMRKVAGDCQSK